MPDKKFLYQLYNKYGGGYPKEFRQWLLQQDLTRPWWTYLAEDYSLQDYMKQLYQSWLSPAPTAEPTPPPTLKDISPEWLAQQDPLATIMSGETVLRKGTPTKKYVVGGQEYSAEDFMVLWPAIQEQMRAEQAQVMTPYEQAQVEAQRQEQQRLATREIRETDWKNRQWEMFYNEERMRRQTGQLNRPEEEELQSELALSRTQAQAFDEFKGQAASVLNQPSDWIKRYQIETAPNMAAEYAARLSSGAQSLGGEIKSTRENLKELSQAAKEVRMRAKDPDDPLTMWAIAEAGNPGGRYDPNASAAYAILTAERTAKNRLENLEAEWLSQKEQPFSEAWRATPQPVGGGAAIYGRGREVAPPSETPGVPDWMAPLINQKAGIQTTKNEYGYPIKYTGIQKGFGTLSGQAMQNLTPAQREQYYGWLNWSEPMGAQRSLELTERMLPRPVRKGSWTPVAQV